MTMTHSGTWRSKRSGSWNGFSLGIESNISRTARRPAAARGGPLQSGISMFSSRFHWDLRPNRLTQALSAKRAAGARILDLTESNPTHAGLHYPAEIVRAFADARMLAYEPEPAGMPAAREAVSAYYATRGHGVPVERIMLTAS